MNISIIGTVGIPAKYGGFETLAENLVINKAENTNYTVYCSAKIYRERQEKYLGAKLRYIRLNANGISSIAYDFICMLLSLNSNVMLILGVSGSIFLPFIRFIYKGKIITNVDGIEWKREKWNKLAKSILRISEKFAVKFSDVVIGDNQGIIDYINEIYKRKAILIEYGGDYLKKNNNDSKQVYCTLNNYAITICRIEPENNIHLVLDAFSRQTKLPIVVVGNWKNSAYGMTLLKKYKGFSHIQLLDPVFESEKINSLRTNALLYIHGHSAGGTNPSLVEAMSFNLPVLAFDCIYNRYTTEEQCLYWSNSEELYSYITQYEKINLNDIGRKMKSIADRRYKWDDIVLKYESLFS